MDYMLMMKKVIPKQLIVMKKVLFFHEEPNLTRSDLQNTYKKFFSHGMSDNIIEFNTFYDEGIMNA